MAKDDRPGAGFQGLYKVKPASQRLVEPLAAWCVTRHVSPDAVSALAIVVAAAGAACIIASTTVPALLLVVPLAAAARLVLNLLDGMVARRLGTTSAMGEMWNELGDRVADTLLIGALAAVPVVGPALGLGAVIAALLASYAGITARAAGGRRQYGGIMSKPGRMIVLAVAAPLAFLSGDGRCLAAAAVIILVGSLVTLGQRVWAAARDDRRAA